MIKNYELIKVVDAEKRKSTENNDYIRVKFNGIDLDSDIKDKDLDIRISMSTNQWNELKKKMNITLDKDLEELKTGKKIKITFDSKAFTTSDDPKPLWVVKTGNMGKHPYAYLELNIAVLILNDIVEKEVFKKDYSGLF